MPAEKSFADYLASREDEYQAAKDRGPGEYPDAEYVMRLENCEGGFAASSNRAQVMFDWKILDGDFKGDSYRQYIGVETEDQLFIVQRQVARLGLEVPETAADLNVSLAQLKVMKPVARTRLRTRTTEAGDFQNLLIQRVLEFEEPEAEAEPEEAEAEPEEAQPEAEAEAEGDEEGVDLEVGHKVLATIKGEEEEGEVLEIDENTGIVRVEMASTGQVWKIAASQLTMVTAPEAEAEAEAEGEPEETPTRRPRKQVTKTTPKKTTAKKKSK